MQEPPEDATYLREQAAKCRRLADAVTDKASINALRKLAEQFEAQATEAEARTPNNWPQPKLEQ